MMNDYSDLDEVVALQCTACHYYIESSVNGDYPEICPDCGEISHNVITKEDVISDIADRANEAEKELK